MPTSDLQHLITDANAARGWPPGAVRLLTPDLLPSAWPDVDRFEGAEYLRILVPVFRPDTPDERELFAVANIYAAVRR